MSDRAAELGLRFSIQDVFRHPTIRELATSLDKKPQENANTTERPTRSALTPRQATLWYLQQSEPKSFAYHFQVRCSANGKLDSQRVARCLADLSRRHPMLRATIQEENGLPEFFVHSDAIVELNESPAMR